MKAVLALLALTFTMLIAVAACSKTEEASETSMTNAVVAATASCNTTAACNEYRTGATFGVEKALCESVKGSFRRGGCDRAGVVARCAMSDGETKSYYGKITIEQAKANCSSDGLKGAFAVITTQK